MKEVVIKIDEGTYNNFVRNEYSRADVIALHTALTNGTPLKTGHWIGDNQAFYIYAKCSECGSVHDTATNFVLNAGVLWIGQSSMSMSRRREHENKITFNV